MRVCSGAGCLRAVEDSIRYCDECRRLPNPADDIKTHSTGYTAELDKLRKSLRWQRLRALVLRSQPMCALCNHALSVLVDHIIPAEIAVMQAQISGKYLDKWAGYFLRSNLQGLCRVCHYEKTLHDKVHSGPWPDVVTIELAAPKRKWSF